MALFRLILGCLLLVAHQAQAEMDAAKAEAAVKSSPCLAGQTIDGTLNDKIHTGSQRDLGWQVFKESEFYEVERAFLMNKSMQLKFRWRINADGSLNPVSKRAEALCQE